MRNRDGTQSLTWPEAIALIVVMAALKVVCLAGGLWLGWQIGLWLAR